MSNEKMPSLQPLADEPLLNRIFALAVEIANEVLPFDRHRLYLRWPKFQNEALWHFTEGMQSGADPAIERQVQDYRDLCRHLTGGQFFITDPIVRAVTYPGESDRPACAVVMRLPDEGIGCLVLGGRRPFGATEAFHLQSIAHLIEGALLWKDQDRIGELLKRLHVGVLHRRTVLQESLSKGDLDRPTLHPKDLLNVYLEKAGFLCLSSWLDRKEVGQSQLEFGVRRAASQVNPNRTTLRIESSRSTNIHKEDKDKWTEQLLLGRSEFDLLGKGEASIPVQAFRTQRPWLINDPQDSLLRGRLFADSKTHLSAPIVAGDRDCLGVLSLETTRAHMFDEYTKVAFALLAASAELFLRLALLREKMKQLEQNRRTISRTRRRLQQCTDWNEVRHELIETFEKMGYDRGLFSEVDQDEQAILGRESWGVRMKDVSNDTRRSFQTDKGDCQIRALTRKKPVIIRDPWSDPRVARSALVKGDLKPFGIFPFLDSHGHVSWTVHVEGRDKAPLEREDMRVVQELCTTAMRAKEGIHLRAVELHWRDILFSHVSFSLDDLLKIFVNFVIKTELVTRCRAYRLREGGLFEGFYQNGIDPMPNFVGHVSKVLPDPFWTFSQRHLPIVVARTGHLPSRRGEFVVRPALAQDEHEYSLTNELSEWLMAPIARDGEILAIVIFDHKGRRRDRFAVREIRLIERLMRALALRGARRAGDDPTKEEERTEGIPSLKAEEGVAGVTLETANPAQEPIPPDRDSLLEKPKKTPLDIITFRPLTPEECQIGEDIRWAQQDPVIQAEFCGQFVVPFQGRIVAHGHDAATVLAEAARETGKPEGELPLVGIIDPLLDIPY